jgi:hypothetical protein
MHFLGKEKRCAIAKIRQKDRFNEENKENCNVFELNNISFCIFNE